MKNRTNEYIEQRSEITTFQISIVRMFKCSIVLLFNYSILTDSISENHNYQRHQKPALGLSKGSIAFVKTFVPFVVKKNRINKMKKITLFFILVHTVMNSFSQINSAQKIIADTISNTVVKLVITYNPSLQNDYIAEHESGVPLTDKYAMEREANKGQIHFPCENKRQYEYKISSEKILSVVSIKYDMDVNDKTDYIFTPDTVFEIHTTTANGGIFTDSSVKLIPNHTDVINKALYPVKNNEPGFNNYNAPCNFNVYFFYLALNFCQKYNIKTKER